MSFPLTLSSLVLSFQRAANMSSDELVQFHSSNHHTHLLSAMWKLRIMGDLCDLTVQVDFHGEQEEFKVHQVVLAASSGFFTTRLLSNEKVKEIVLCDVPPNAFGKFLEFVYSGKMEVEGQCISDILDMAKLLQCQDLVEACEELLLRSGVLEQKDLSNFNKNDKNQRKVLKKEKKRKKRPNAENPPESQSNKRDRRSRRLGGRRVKVDFSSENVPLETDNVEAQNIETPENVQVEPLKESLGENDILEDDEAESTDNVLDEDPGEQSDYVPEMEQDIEDEVQMRGKKISPKFRCEDCSRSFQYEKSFHKHLKLSHGVETDITFRCDICQQTFASRCNLKLHQRHVHSDQRLFPCDICGKSFKRKKDVTRHRRHVHEGGTDRFICMLCGKSLSSKTALMLHGRTHTGLKPYKCDFCGSSFSQASALKTHKRTHSGEKPFVCDLCDAKFSQNHMLVYHRRCHTGEKPFMCENCGKSFASKEYLKHHSRIHSGIRPYKCETCGRAFAQRNSLHQHMKIHTGTAFIGTHDKETPWKNYLVVLEGNVEERAEKPKPSSKKKSKASSSTPKADLKESMKTGDVLEVSGEPVTISENWAASGTIALVSHTPLGGLTVIQTEVPAGTQLQPLVTTDGTNVISLEASSIGVPVTVPFSIPITVSSGASVSVPITVSDVSMTVPASRPEELTIVECESIPAKETQCTESQEEGHENVQTAEASNDIDGSAEKVEG
ncbi:hypothetical protein DNTS_005157 [Danionella cerebrum]|uniref:BTB domain-containing protein n=1 Tax=Danionella cerebrum TaxID=2873325 RepID=A0A553QEW3_9TELE|nr:hypothetical protein DNTS_005157 [Danionella translucida]